MLEPQQHISSDTDLIFRPANVVMDLNRLGALYPYPLSFMRCLMRRIMREEWRIIPKIFDLDKDGYLSLIHI